MEFGDDTRSDGFLGLVDMRMTEMNVRTWPVHLPHRGRHVLRESFSKYYNVNLQFLRPNR
jgi:hypothetical protein